jgi:hypothetical protein
MVLPWNVANFGFIAGIEPAFIVLADPSVPSAGARNHRRGALCWITFARVITAFAIGIALVRSLQSSHVNPVLVNGPYIQPCVNLNGCSHLPIIFALLTAH